MGLFALLVADALLVPRQFAGLGGTGAALGLMAMTVTSGIVQVRAVRQHTGIGFYWRAVRHLLAGLVMYLSMQAISASLAAVWPWLGDAGSWWVRLPLFSLLGLAVYLAILALLRQFTRADVEVFWNVLHPARMAEYISTELDTRR